MKHEFTVTHIPCLKAEPPKPPKIVGDHCPPELEYCLAKDQAWTLALYIESTILWMHEAWNKCKEIKDD